VLQSPPRTALLKAYRTDQGQLIRKLSNPWQQLLRMREAEKRI
jgi:hypothetical protein